jgi:hypothetical protein
MKIDRDKHDTRDPVSKRQKKKKKCPKATIMAMVLTQHECMHGHPDNWEPKVNEYT